MKTLNKMSIEDFINTSIDLEVKRIIKDECKVYGEFKTTEILKETVNDLTFVVCHTNIATSKKQHRYNIIAFNGTNIIYKDSNIIDKTFYKSIDELKTIVKRYFLNISNKLKDIN